MGSITTLKSSIREPAPARPAGDAGVVVAAGLRLRGAQGRLTARLVRGGIDQLEGRDWVMVGRPGQDPRRLDIEEYSIYGDRVVLKFRGVDTAEDAASLAGQDILMPCNGLVDLPEGSYYIFELVGLTVRTRHGRAIGIVRDVVWTGGTPLLAVETPEGKELLIPFAEEYCSRIAPAEKLIEVVLPEGLRDLNE